MHGRTNHEDVVRFFDKFGVPRAVAPSLPDAETFRFRFHHLQEELIELADAFDSRNLEDYADALVDLVYLALGTAIVSGLPWQLLWDEVQRANMTKVRAAADGSDSKRGSPLDVVKPEGWVGPDHADALTGRHQCPYCARTQPRDDGRDRFCGCGVYLCRVEGRWVRPADLFDSEGGES